MRSGIKGNMAHKVFHLIKSTFIISIEIVISILLSTVIIPLGLLVTSLNELIRLIISGILYVQYRNTPSKISLADEGADNIWAYKKPNNARMCLALLFCAKPINITQHRKLYMSRVLNHTTKHGRKPYEKLRKILITRYGYNCHKHDSNFDIQNHVKFWPGSAEVANDAIVGETQLMTEILPTLFKDMTEDKPQWEEVIVPRFSFHDDSSICSVRIFRYHHSLMDGASNLLMWTFCMTEDQGASYPYPVNPLVDSGKVSKYQRFIYDLSCFVIGTFTMLKSTIYASQLKNRFVTTKYSGNRHFGWSESINVKTLRRIKATYKVSVPAMLTTALGSAFRKLNEKYPSVHYGNPEEVVIGLVSALMPYANHNLRNQFTVVHFPVYTGSKEGLCRREYENRNEENIISNGIVKRLQMTSRNMTRIGRDPVVYLNYFMFKYFGRFPANIVQGLMENGGLPVVLSNVPMSTEIVEFWDNPVVTALGFPPLLTNTGLGIVTMRYADHMRFCAVTDDACLSPEALNYFLKEVITELNAIADVCSDFETVVHKSDKEVGNDSLVIPAAVGNSITYNSYINPKNVPSTVVTMDFRRGSLPSQIIDTIENF